MISFERCSKRAKESLNDKKKQVKKYLNFQKEKNQKIFYLN